MTDTVTATRLDIAIVGPGKVGTAIGILARRAGFPVVAVGGRDPVAAQAAAVRIGDDVAATALEEAAASAHLVFLTVTDDAIAPVADDLARRGCFRPGAVVVHSSGALPSSILSPARSRSGCSVASAHPLQTFPTVDSAVRDLPGAYWFCEGDPQALSAVRVLIEAMGSRCVEIRPEAKPLYHACAVFASNYLAALLDASLKCASLAGIGERDALAALAPLVRATADNVAQLGTRQALTGPIARGDSSTVARHLDALHQADPALARLYAALGNWTLPMAVAKGSLSEEAARALTGLLGQRPPAGIETVAPHTEAPPGHSEV